MVAPVALPLLAGAGRLGARYAPSLMNLGRRLFSPGPWQKTKMQQRARGFGKEPITNLKQRRAPAGATRNVEKYGRIIPQAIGGRYGRGRMRVPETVNMPKGFVQRHPLVAGSIAAPLAIGAGAGIYGALRGEEEIPEGEVTAPIEGWSAPEDILSLAEQARADAETGKQNMKKMLKYGFLISAAGGNPEKFFNRAAEMTKATAAYKQNERYAKQVDAVFVKGNMPKDARTAFDRLRGVGMAPKEAMEITGLYAGMSGKTEAERALNNLKQILETQGEEAAASLLVMYWSTGQLEGAPEYAGEDELYAAALAAVRGGGLGAREPTGEEVEIL